MSETKYKKVEGYLKGELPEAEISEIESYLGDNFRDEELTALLRSHWSDLDVDPMNNEGHQAFKNFCKTTNIHEVSLLESKNRRAERLSRACSHFRNIAAILAIPLLLYSIFHVSTEHEPVELNYVEYAVANGKIDSLRLPDNSLVVLNSGSKVIYPTEFGKTSRQVFISGEGYFEVEKDPERPFSLSFGNIKVTVLGTRFNVQAYEEMQNYVVSLIEGSVEMGVVGTNDSNQITESVVLDPGDVVSYNKTTGHLSHSNASVDVYSLWKRGDIYFKNQPFGQIAMQLERLFNQEILILDNELSKTHLSLAFVNNESLEKILIDISEALAIDIQDHNGVKIITKKK